MTVPIALFMLINFIDKVGIGLVAVPMMAELSLSPTEFGWVAGSFFWLFALYFMALWGLALTLTWFPAHLQKGLGFDALTSGRLFALLTLIDISIGLALSWWSQRVPARGATSRHGRALLSSTALIVGGALIVALMLLPMADMTKVILLAVGGGLTGVIFALAPAMVGSVSPNAQRGAMLAILNSIASIAGVLAPAVTGSLIQNATGSTASGYEHGFALSGALLVVGGIVGLIWVNPEKSIARHVGIR